MIDPGNLLNQFMGGNNGALPGGTPGSPGGGGHIDATEQVAIFNHVDKLSLDAENKAAVFDLLRQPVDIDALVNAVKGVEQASEVYLVSRMAIDVDHPAERAYLEALAHRLQLPTELIAHLDHQVEG